MTLNGRDYYLGSYGTKTSKIEYDRLIGEWLAAGRVAPATESSLTLVELAAAYRRWAESYYVKHGQPTRTVGQVIFTLRTLCKGLG